MATEYAPAVWVDGQTRDPEQIDICTTYEAAWELAEQYADNYWAAGGRDVRIAVIHREVGTWEGDGRVRLLPFHGSPPPLQRRVGDYRITDKGVRALHRNSQLGLC